MKEIIKWPKYSPKDAERQDLVNEDEQKEDERPLSLHPIEEIGPLIGPRGPNRSQYPPQHAEAVEWEYWEEIENGEADVNLHDF